MEVSRSPLLLGFQTLLTTPLQTRDFIMNTVTTRRAYRPYRKRGNGPTPRTCILSSDADRENLRAVAHTVYGATGELPTNSFIYSIAVAALREQLTKRSRTALLRGGQARSLFSKSDETGLRPSAASAVA